MKEWTEEKIAMMKTILQYEEEFFDDMTLKKYEKELFTNGEGKYADNSLVPDITEWDIKEVEDLESRGQCLPNEKTILILKGLNDIERRNIILHEMIHAYESMLLSMHRDYIFLSLYESLQENLTKEKLWTFCKTHSNLYFNPVSNHSLLFLFKSLDLDLRLNLPFGTILGYGREEYFNHERMDTRGNQGLQEKA